MEGIQKFNAFTYKTVDGETVTATKKDGVVTLAGDKNGIRQMPLDDFKKEFLATVPKLERTPSADTVSFSGKDKAVDENQTPQKEASSRKKWGVGIASAFIPGLGQAINGEWGKAAGFFFGGIAGSVVAATTLPIIGLAGLGLGSLAGIGLGIWSIVDAVKSAKAD